MPKPGDSWAAPTPQVVAYVQRQLGAEFWRNWFDTVNRIGRDFPEAEITSWWRDPARNRAAGGAALSPHLAGLAVDVRTPRAEQLAQRARAAGFHTILYPPGRSGKPRVHIAALPGPKLAPVVRGLLGSLFPGAR